MFFLNADKITLEVILKGMRKLTKDENLDTNPDYPDYLVIKEWIMEKLQK